MPRKPKTCPFCDAPKSAYPKGLGHDEATYECSTVVDNGGDEERTRTHQCYMNQIKALQTGDTEYGTGFNDGVEAMREIMNKAVHNNHDWLLKNPPMRRKGTRYEDTHKSN